MSAAVIEMDLNGARVRTRWSMTLSTVIHALLLLLLVTYRGSGDRLPEITEITLLEPGPPAAEASGAAAPAAAARTSPGLARAGSADQRFRRDRDRADFVPEPQSRTALEDRLAARIASLQGREVAPVASTSAAGVPSGLWGPASAGTGSGAGTGPLALTRGGSGGAGTALQLTRGGGSGIGPAVVSTGIPSQGSAASAPAKGGEASARRNLAGATLMGPIADRPVITYATPAYPEWAKREAVEGSVTLYFVVRPDGTVKENVLVQKTAGFEDFDENARAALRAWRFQPLAGGRTGEQWGTITFHFRLREAG